MESRVGSTPATEMLALFYFVLLCFLFCFAFCLVGSWGRSTNTKTDTQAVCKLRQPKPHEQVFPIIKNYPPGSVPEAALSCDRISRCCELKFQNNNNNKNQLTQGFGGGGRERRKDVLTVEDELTLGNPLEKFCEFESSSGSETSVLIKQTHTQKIIKIPCLLWADEYCMRARQEVELWLVFSINSLTTSHFFFLIPAAGWRRRRGQNGKATSFIALCMYLRQARRAIIFF